MIINSAPHTPRLFNQASLKKKLVILGIIVVSITIIFFAIRAIFVANKKNSELQSGAVNPIVESYKQQLPSLAKTADENQNDSAAHKNYAVALYATGDIQNAYDQYQAAIKINSNDPILYNNLGNAARDLSKYDEAIGAYQKAISLNPKAINSYVNLANLYIFTLGQVDLGIEVYTNALTANPENIDLQVQLAIAYEQKENISEATSIYKEILKNNPENPAALAGLKRVEGVSNQPAPSATPESDSADEETTTEEENI